MTSLTVGKDRQLPDVKKPTEVGSFTPDADQSNRE
ncbi:Uncharacterised protein [Serratia proteamaculans]|nr:Uncharacterised protein [Serratia proteamaculans]